MPHRIMEQMRKSARRAFSVALFIMLVTALTHQANGEPLWRQLTPRPKVDADPGRDYGLTESNGPWLILAATFSGEGAEQQARDLVHEFRADHSLPAYLHRMTFDLAAGAPMRGRDRTGRPKRAKYQRGDAVTEFAVLDPSVVLGAIRCLPMAGPVRDQLSNAIIGAASGCKVKVC